MQSRKELLGATIDVSLADQANYEEQSLLTSERIERGTNRLRDAQRVAIESEGTVQSKLLIGGISCLLRDTFQ